ncbi:MAG TPA: TetR/AcrR family transcriptional regulator [Syntrophomonadaceae bacterium]|nr:TetR/AcrR family transcriptional regulator [Syntrophomonadaceae bacterium]
MTRKEPKDKRISDILDSAISEFLENGYEKTSMEAIARRVNLTKGGLYYHFSSKDEILLAANRVLFEPVGDLMTECAGFARATEGLRHFIDQYLRYHMERPQNVIFFFLSMTKVMASPQLSGMYREYTEQYTAFFEGLFTRAVEEGDLRPHNTHAQALAYESALDGVLWYLAVNEKFTFEETIKGFEEVFIDSLRTPKSS